MNAVWYLLTDNLSRNHAGRVGGVLGGVQDMVVAQQLRRGIMDSDIFVTREAYDPASETCTGIGTKGLCVLPGIERTEAFLSKRALVQIRISGFVVWRQIITAELQLQYIFYTDTDLYFAQEIAKSTSESISEGLMDYAYMAELQPMEAFEYAKLYAEEQRDKRLMLHALAEKYSRKINACSTQTEVNAVCTEMKKYGRFYG